MNTPKALANFSLGLERRDNPRSKLEKCINPERVSSAANPYRVDEKRSLFPGVLALLEPRAEISQRLRRTSNCSLRV